MLEREKKSMYNKILIKILYKKELAGRGHRQLPRELLHLLLRGSLGQFLASTFGWHHTASCQHRSAQQGLINPSPQTYRLVSRRVKIELIIRNRYGPNLSTPAPQSWGYKPALPGLARRELRVPFYASLLLLNTSSGTIFFFFTCVTCGNS